MPGQTEEAEEAKVPTSAFLRQRGERHSITTERIGELEKENTTYKNLKGQGRVKAIDTQRS